LACLSAPNSFVSQPGYRSQAQEEHTFSSAAPPALPSLPCLHYLLKQRSRITQIKVKPGGKSVELDATMATPVETAVLVGLVFAGPDSGAESNSDGELISAPPSRDRPSAWFTVSQYASTTPGGTAIGPGGIDPGVARR
ncbi:MAG: hypothetical protein ACP5RH_12005, partial [Leptodesmis sp.]|uniref:hypothetical protein n=1 Tax=Leptodesmis sp. TaxID=3100501 RepID=UPI003D0F989C